MTIEFKYLNELGLFVQLFLLGAILCTIVMYITETVKKWLADINFFKNHSKSISVICFLVSMAFGISWTKTFANETINFAYSIWLGILLYLGSTGLYTKLENSDGFWGKTVQPFSKYISSNETVSTILSNTQAETKQSLSDETKENPNKAAVALTKTTAADLKPEKTSSSQQYLTYTVVKGDTLWDIEGKYLGDNMLYTDIMTLNGLTSNIIEIGQVLKLYPISNNVSGTFTEEFDRFYIPLKYISVSGEFIRGEHNGVDFGYSNDPTQPVYAACEGTVDMITSGGTAGNLIRIKHDGRNKKKTRYTYYKHLSQIDVAIGQSVSALQKIGNMGTSGTTAYHLHHDLVEVDYGVSYSNESQSQRTACSLNALEYEYVASDATVGDVTVQKYKLLYT